MQAVEVPITVHGIQGTPSYGSDKALDTRPSKIWFSSWFNLSAKILFHVVYVLRSLKNRYMTYISLHMLREMTFISMDNNAAVI